MAQVKLAKADEIPDGGMIMKEHEGRQILLARIEGQVYAMDNICNHQGAELHEGDLGQEGPHLVTCPWHGYQYRPEDVQSPPPFTEKVPTYNLSM